MKLKTYGRPVIYLPLHLHAKPDELVDYDTDFDGSDRDYLADYDAQFKDTIYQADMERQYQDYIIANTHMVRNTASDDERRRNREGYRDSALYEHNTWNRFKTIENNSRDNYVPGGVRG